MFDIWALHCRYVVVVVVVTMHFSIVNGQIACCQER